MNVCIGCLSSDSKMFHIQAEDLLFYQRLVDTPLKLLEQFSYIMCWECIALLRKLKLFSKNCFKARNALLTLAAKNDLNVKAVSETRKILKLESNLSTVILEPCIDQLMTVKEEIDQQNSEFKNEEKIISYKSFDKDKLNINNNERKKAKKSKRKSKCQKNEDNLSLSDLKKQNRIKGKIKTVNNKLKNNGNEPNIVKDNVRDLAENNFTDIDDVDVEKNVDTLTTDKNGYCQVVKKSGHNQRRKDIEKVFHVIAFTQEDMVSDMVRRREKMGVSAAQYKCQLCCKIFRIEKTYRNHCNMDHDETTGPYTCDVCGVRRSSRRSLRAHIHNSHMFVFRCKTCNFNARRFSQAWKHKSFHEGKTYICEICGKISRHLNVYYAHLSRMHSGNNHHCLSCGANFNSQNGLKVHITRNSFCSRDISVTLATRKYCDKCDVTFANEDAILNHNRLLHDESKQSKNNLQFRPYKRKAAYVPKKKTDTERISCEQCGRIYEGERNYKLHLSAHSGITHKKPKKFLCQTCGKYFTTTTSLKIHNFSTHLNMRMFPCKECDKKYKTPAALDVHINANHRGTKYKCYFCVREYSQSASLVYHLRTTHFNVQMPKRIRNKKRVVPHETAVTE